MAAVEKADYWGLPLHIYGNPLDWLRAEGGGAVILDWHCCLHFWLAGVARILCDDTQVADRIEGQLRTPISAPEVRVKEACHAT